MRASMLAAGACVLLSACDGKKDAESNGLSKRPLKPEHAALVRRFADLVVRKEYTAAFEAMSETYRKDVGWEDFNESIRRYREGAIATPTYEISATEDDPKKVPEDSVVELFVPADLRSRIVEEVAIHFTVKEKDGEEGFWALVCWIVEENGAPRILNYYQDD